MPTLSQGQSHPSFLQFPLKKFQMKSSNMDTQRLVKVNFLFIC